MLMVVFQYLQTLDNNCFVGTDGCYGLSDDNTLIRFRRILTGRGFIVVPIVVVIVVYCHTHA